VLVRTDTAAWRRVIASARSSLQATSQLLYRSNNGPEARGISDINLILINKDKLQFIEPLTVLGAGKVSRKLLHPNKADSFTVTHAPPALGSYFSCLGLRRMNATNSEQICDFETWLFFLALAKLHVPRIPRSRALPSSFHSSFTSACIQNAG